jgi:hypothetical protein
VAEGTKRVQQVAQLTPSNRTFFKQWTFIPLINIFNNFMELKDRDINKNEKNKRERETPWEEKKKNYRMEEGSSPCLIGY